MDPSSSLKARLFPVFVLLLGMCIFGAHLFGIYRGTTPEDELTLAEGVPDGLKVSYGKGTTYLKFSVDGYRTEYSSDRPRFTEVNAAVGGNVPVKMWVSTKQETIFPRDGWVPLYKMSRDGIPVLSYQQTVATHSYSTGLIIGAVMIVFSVIGIYQALRDRRRAQTVGGS